MDDRDRTEAVEQSDANVTKFKLGPATAAYVRNLERLQRVNNASSALYRNKLAGRCAIIVGAGPSLNEAIEQLKWIPRGNPIFAVNTALPALLKAGIKVDFTVSVELLPVLHGLGVDSRDMGRVITNIAASEHTMELAAKTCGFFVTGIHFHQARTHEVLGVEPMVHRSALTAAVQVARHWGAAQIVLVGADMGWTDEKVYADGTPWEATTGKVEGDRLRFQDCQERHDLHLRFGYTNVPKQRPISKIPAWGGVGEVFTITEFDSQRLMLEELGAGMETTFPVNCSRGGALIAGWGECPFDAAVRLYMREHEPLGFEDTKLSQATIDRAMVDIHSQAQNAEVAFSESLELTRPGRQTFARILAGEMDMAYGLALPDHLHQLELAQSGKLGEQQVLTARALAGHRAAHELRDLWRWAKKDRRVLTGGNVELPV